MLHIAVYGNSKWSDLLAELLEAEYSAQVQSMGGEALCVDKRITLSQPVGPNEISIEAFSSLYSAGSLAAIVIPKEYYNQQDMIIHALIRHGVDIDAIYCARRLYESREQLAASIEALITPYLSDPYLAYLEFHGADHCNLNCKYCTHYSPLVKHPVFPDYDRFERDLRQLKKYVYDIGIIRIVGGEPLLNPELPRFVRMVRQLYPASIISIVTNGLLIEKISEELIQTMKECTAFFHISLYAPVEPKIKQIQQFLYEKGIVYTTSPLNDVFFKTQTLEQQENEDYFYKCFQGTCTCIQDGKIAPCYAPFTTKYFNETFGQALPTNEGIDLYDSEISLPLIKGRLLLPMERCRYCQGGLAEKWSIIGKSSSLEDWV